MKRIGTSMTSAALIHTPVKLSAAMSARKKEVPREVSRTVVLKARKIASGGPARRSWAVRKY